MKLTGLNTLYSIETVKVLKNISSKLTSIETASTSNDQHILNILNAPFVDSSKLQTIYDIVELESKKLMALPES